MRPTQSQSSPRSFRLFRAATLLTALVTTAAAAGAQRVDARPFENSWFWGLHAGGTSVGTPSHSSTTAGTIGGEWLITRQRGGLYLSYDQANFTGSSRTTTSPVDIHDMHTFSIAGLAFPFELGALRPYAGVGYALSVLGTATARADSTGTVQPEAANAADAARSHSSILGIVGAQWQVQRVALFAQLTAMPSDASFLVTKPVSSVVAGVRYNFGSSIDR